MTRRTGTSVASSRVVVVVLTLLTPVALIVLAAAPGPAAGGRAPGAAGTVAPRLVLDVAAGDPVDTGGDGRLSAGDRIPLVFRVGLTGARGAVVYAVHVHDSLGTRVECRALRRVVAGTVAVCRAVHRVTAADLAAGTVDETAYADGLAGSPTDGSRIVSRPDSTSTSLAAVAGLTLIKQVAPVSDTNVSGRVDSGDIVSFDYLVTNTGDLPLHETTVRDDSAVEVTCPDRTLKPGHSVRCLGGHTLDQDDMDSGRLAGAAVALARTPSGSPVRSLPQRTTQLLPGTPAIGLEAHVQLDDLDGDGLADPGEELLYQFRVIDAGATSLTGVEVSDPRLEAAKVAVRCPTRHLGPGQSMTCAAAYRIGAGDVADRIITTTADVRARSNGVVTSRYVETTVATDGTGRTGRAGETGSRRTMVWVAGGAGLAGLALLGAVATGRLRRRERAGRPVRS